MAKTKSNRNGGGAKQRGNWSNADHDARTTKRIESLNKKRRRQQQLQEEEADDEPQPASNTNPHLEPTPKRPKEPHHEQPIHQLRKKAHRSSHNRLTAQVDENAYKRSHLAHDNFDKIDSSKLRLATAQVQRKVNILKDRLEHWDPIEEASLLKALINKEIDNVNSIEHKMKIDAQNRLLDRTSRQTAAGEYALIYAQHGTNSSTNRRKANLKSKPRKGPESWKLRGAARPAWEVYDFDTRFVDVHIKAHEDANLKSRRSVNVVRECRGRFAFDGDDDEIDGDGISENHKEMKNGNDNGDNKSGNNGNKKKQKQFSPPQPHCRQYLSLLTQLGSLQLHRKNYSSARTSFLEAIDLEGPQHPESITNARYQLMNMYLTTNRPSSARKLWNLVSNDGSAWIKYSAALIEYVSWNLLQEDGSTAQSAERLLTQAIRGNVHVAYLLGWPSMFERSMEYTHEICDGGIMDSKSGSVLEAIEYGCCCYSNSRGSNESSGGEGGGDGGGGEDDMEKGMGMWLGTEGSLDWVRSVVLRVLNESENNDRGTNNNDADRLLTRADLTSWEMKLSKEEEEFERVRNEKEASKSKFHYEKISDDDHASMNSEEDEEEEEPPDVVMYGGMFRTAMDWLQDAGDFLKEPTYDYVSEQAEVEDNDDAVVVDGAIDDDGVKEKADDDDSSDDESSSDRGSVSKEKKGNTIAHDQEVDDDDDESSTTSSDSSTNQ